MPYTFPEAKTLNAEWNRTTFIPVRKISSQCGGYALGDPDLLLIIPVLRLIYCRFWHTEQFMIVGLLAVGEIMRFRCGLL